MGQDTLSGRQGNEIWRLIGQSVAQNLGILLKWLTFALSKCQHTTTYCTLSLAEAIERYIHFYNYERRQKNPLSWPA